MSIKGSISSALISGAHGVGGSRDGAGVGSREDGSNNYSV